MFGTFSSKNKILCKTKIDRCVKRAEKITHSSFDFVDDLITSLSLKQIENSDNPLANKIQRSVRSNRPIFVKTRTQRFSRSFIPFAIKLIEYKR